MIYYIEQTQKTGTGQTVYADNTNCKHLERLESATKMFEKFGESAPFLSHVAIVKMRDQLILATDLNDNEKADIIKEYDRMIQKLKETLEIEESNEMNNELEKMSVNDDN